MDIVNTLPNEFTQNNTSDKDVLFAQQTQEIKKLKLENDLLKELIINKKI